MVIPQSHALLSALILNLLSCIQTVLARAPQLAQHHPETALLQSIHAPHSIRCPAKDQTVQFEVIGRPMVKERALTPRIPHLARGSCTSAFFYHPQVVPKCSPDSLLEFMLAHEAVEPLPPGQNYAGPARWLAINKLPPICGRSGTMVCCATGSHSYRDRDRWRKCGIPAGAAGGHHATVRSQIRVKIGEK